MAAPLNDMSDSKICVVEATVVTGFEEVAKQEAEEKFGTTCKILRGRISFECPVEVVNQVTDLGCVDNCRVIMLHIPDFRFTDDQTENLQRLRNLVGTVDWPAGLQVWRKFFSFEHGVADRPEHVTTGFGDVIIPPPRQNPPGEKLSRRQKRKNKKQKRQDMKTKENGSKSVEEDKNTVEDLTETNSAVTDSKDGDTGTESAEIQNVSCESVTSLSNKPYGDSNSKSEESEVAKVKTGELDGSATKKPRVRENPWNPMMPSFRVTCIRNGDNHNFDSMTAASNFGGAIYRYFGWNVKLTEFDIEVILCIEDQTVTVSIGLTKESLHRRNITHFGPTTLRPTIAYSMLRLCDIKKGEVVCDPMCGSGSIPIQGALNWSFSPQICGEIAGRALNRYKGNLTDMNETRLKENKSSLLVDAVRWDVCKLPLRDHSVDVFITDLPFGVRMGHKVDNWKLYPGALIEMARVVKPGTGRCCLLTEDKKCMIKTLHYLYKYWKRVKTLGVNIGGLTGGVYLLTRTCTALDDRVNRNVFAPRGKKGSVSPTLEDSPEPSYEEN